MIQSRVEKNRTSFQHTSKIFGVIRLHHREEGWKEGGRLVERFERQMVGAALLLRAGASLAMLDATGSNALHYAMEAGGDHIGFPSKALQLILLGKLDPAAAALDTDLDTDTLEDTALRAVPMLSGLIQQANYSGRTPTMVGCAYGQAGSVEALLNWVRGATDSRSSRPCRLEQDGNKYKGGGKANSSKDSAARGGLTVLGVLSAVDWRYVVSCVLSRAVRSPTHHSPPCKYLSGAVGLSGVGVDVA